MKETQNPVIDRAKPGSQFVNAVSQQIGLGPSQFMAQFRQAANTYHAFGISLRIPRKGQTVDCSHSIRRAEVYSGCVWVLSGRTPAQRSVPAGAPEAIAYHFRSSRTRVRSEE